MPDDTMPRCVTCKHWTPYPTKYPEKIRSDGVDDGGICESEKLTEDWGGEHGADMLVYPYTEGGHFWTGPEFGCVHHQPKGESEPNPPLSFNMEWAELVEAANELSRKIEAERRSKTPWGRFKTAAKEFFRG